MSLQSKFFKGLKRVKTDNGFQFRKGHMLVTTYPDSFTVAVGAFSERTLKGSDFPGRPLRVPSDEIPRRVMLRWKDSSGKVLQERSLALEEVVESWPELRNANVWYRANVSGIHQPLSAELEISIFAQAHSPAEIARMCSLGQCAAIKRGP